MENRDQTANEMTAARSAKRLRGAGVAMGLALALLFASPLCAAEQKDAILALAVDDGVLVVWNQPGDHFTLRIRGKQVEPLPGEGHVFFRVDGAVVQLKSVLVSGFLADRQGKDDLAILEAHRDWEAAYVRDALKIPDQLHSSKTTLPGGRVALLWGFDMPPELKSEASKQIYLSMVHKDRVVLLNGAVTPETTQEAVEKLLKECLGTYQASEEPIDVQALQERIRKGGNP